VWGGNAHALAFFGAGRIYYFRLPQPYPCARKLMELPKT
jgi:hypothetical protein